MMTKTTTTKLILHLLKHECKYSSQYLCQQEHFGIPIHFPVHFHTVFVGALWFTQLEATEGIILPSAG